MLWSSDPDTLFHKRQLILQSSLYLCFLRQNTLLLVIVPTICALILPLISLQLVLLIMALLFVWEMGFLWIRHSADLRGERERLEDRWGRWKRTCCKGWDMTLEWQVIFNHQRTRSWAVRSWATRVRVVSECACEQTLRMNCTCSNMSCERCVCLHTRSVVGWEKLRIVRRWRMPGIPTSRRPIVAVIICGRGRWRRKRQVSLVLLIEPPACSEIDCEVIPSSTKWLQVQIGNKIENNWPCNRLQALQIYIKSKTINPHQNYRRYRRYSFK